MQYFIDGVGRRLTHSSCYHEFFRGKWDGHTHWRDDSICLHDDLMPQGFVRAMLCVVPEYNYYGPTNISVEQWKQLGRAIEREDKAAQEIYREADAWLEEVFREHGCFTIMGI